MPRTLALFVLLAMIGSACGGPTGTPAKTDAKANADADADANANANADAHARAAWSFDDAKPDTVPAPVRTVQTGEPAELATWAVVAEPTAPSPPHAFGVTKTVGKNKTFNVALFEGTSWKDLDLAVALRPTSGTNNQGGGVVFRAKSENDHYVARWNPVEKNFRIYALVGGARVDIAAADLDLDAKAWHTLRVVAQGDTIECFVDDDPIVRASDKTFPAAGMIGLWTKGDAATLFDDLVVAPP